MFDKYNRYSILEADNRNISRIVGKFLGGSLYTLGVYSRFYIERMKILAQICTAARNMGWKIIIPPPRPQPVELAAIFDSVFGKKEKILVVLPEFYRNYINVLRRICPDSVAFIKLLEAIGENRLIPHIFSILERNTEESGRIYRKKIMRKDTPNIKFLLSDFYHIRDHIITGATYTFPRPPFMPAGLPPYYGEIFIIPKKVSENGTASEKKAELFRTAGHAADIEYGIFPRVYLITGPDIYRIAFKSRCLPGVNNPAPYRGTECPSEESYLYASYYLDCIRKVAESYRSKRSSVKISGEDGNTPDMMDEIVFRTVVGVISLLKGIVCNINGVHVFRTESIRNLVTGIVINRTFETVDEENNPAEILNRTSLYIRKLFDNGFKLLWELTKEAGEQFYSDLGFPIPDPALLYGLEHGESPYTLLETERKILCVPDIIASGLVEYIVKQMTVPDGNNDDRSTSEIFPNSSGYENGDSPDLRRWSGKIGNRQNDLTSDNIGDFSRDDNNPLGIKGGRRGIRDFLALCIEGDLIYELFDNILYLYNAFYRTAPGISVEGFLEEYVPRFMDFIGKLAERYGIYGDRDTDGYAVRFLTPDRIRDYIRAFGSLVRFTCGPEYRMCNMFEKEGRYVYGDVFRNPSRDKDIFTLYVKSPNYGTGHRRIIAEYREDYPKDIESELNGVTENIDKIINGEADNLFARKGPIITGPLYHKIISRKITESIGITDFADYMWNQFYRILYYKRGVYREDSPPERVFISDLGINTVWTYTPAVIPFVYLLNFSTEPSGSSEIFSECMSILRDCVRWLISDLHRNYGIYIALFGGMIYTEYQIYAKNLAAANILPVLFFDIINARSPEDYRGIAQFIMSILAGPMNIYGIFPVLHILIGYLKKVSDPFVKRMCNLSELLIIRYISDPLSEITEWKEIIEKEAAESGFSKIYEYLYGKMCSFLDKMGFPKKPIMPVIRRDVNSERNPDVNDLIVYKIGLAVKYAEDFSSSSEYGEDVKDGTEYPAETGSDFIRIIGAVRYWLTEIEERIKGSLGFGKGAVNKKAGYTGDAIYAFAAGLVSLREERFYPEIDPISDSLLSFIRRYMTPNLFAVFLQDAFISVNCFLPYSFCFYPEFLIEFYDVFAYDLLLWFKFFYKNRPINNDMIFGFYDRILKKLYPSVEKIYDPEPYLHQIYSTFARYSAFLFGKDAVDYYSTLRFAKRVKIGGASLNELIGGIDFLTLLLHYITYVIDGETDRFKTIRNLLLLKYYPTYFDKIRNTVYYGADNISEFSLKLRLITLDAVYREILLTERFFYRNNFGYLEGLDKYYSEIKEGKIDITVNGPDKDTLFEGFPNKDLYANIYDTYTFLYELIRLRTRLEEISGEFGKKMGDFSSKFADISERIIFPEKTGRDDSGYSGNIEDIGYGVSASDGNTGNASFGGEFDDGDRGYLRDIIDRRYSDIEKPRDKSSDVERDRFIRDKMERLVGDKAEDNDKDTVRKSVPYFREKIRKGIMKIMGLFRSHRKGFDAPNTELHSIDTDTSARIRKMLSEYVEEKERLLYPKYIYYTPYSGLFVHLLFTVYLYFYERGDSPGLLSVLGKFRKLITGYLTVSIYSEIYLILLLKTILYFIERDEYADAENLLYYIEELRDILDKRDPDSPILSDDSLLYSYKGAISASPSVLHIARDILPEIYEIVSSDRLISPDMYDKLYEILLQTESIALYMFVSDGMDGDCGKIKEFVDKAVKNFYIKPDAMRAATLLDIIKNAMNIFLKYSEEEYARYLTDLLDDLEDPMHDLLVERYYTRKNEILERAGLPLSALLILEILERSIIDKSEPSEEESEEFGGNAIDEPPSSEDGENSENRVDAAENSEGSESGGENKRLTWETIFRLRTLAGEDPIGELFRMLSDLDKIDKRIKETRKRLLLKILRLYGHKKDREKFSEIYDRYVKEYGTPDPVENTDDLLYILGSELLLYSDVFDEGYADELGNKISEILEAKTRLLKKRAGKRGIRGVLGKIFGLFSANLPETELLKFYELGVPLYYYTIIKVYVLDNIGKEEREGFRRVIGEIKRTIRKYGVLKFYSRLRRKALKLVRKHKIKNIGWILKPLDALPEIYATALLLPTFRFPFDEKGKKPSRYLKELGKIYDKFDYNVYIANVYARGLLNLLYGALSSDIDMNYSGILKKIAGLVRRFPNDPELRDIMEAALLLLYDKFKGGDLR